MFLNFLLIRVFLVILFDDIILKVVIIIFDYCLKKLYIYFSYLMIIVIICFEIRRKIEKWKVMIIGYVLLIRILILN